MERIKYKNYEKLKGLVEKVLVQEGDYVNEGQSLAVISTQDESYEVISHINGIIKSVYIANALVLSSGDVIFDVYTKDDFSKLVTKKSTLSDKVKSSIEKNGFWSTDQINSEDTDSQIDLEQNESTMRFNSLNKANNFHSDLKSDEYFINNSTEDIVNNIDENQSFSDNNTNNSSSNFEMSNKQFLEEKNVDSTEDFSSFLAKEHKKFKDKNLQEEEINIIDHELLLETDKTEGLNESAIEQKVNDNSFLNNFTNSNEIHSDEPSKYSYASPHDIKKEEEDVNSSEFRMPHNEKKNRVYSINETIEKTIEIEDENEKMNSLINIMTEFDSRVNNIDEKINTYVKGFQDSTKLITSSLKEVYSILSKQKEDEKNKPESKVETKVIKEIVEKQLVGPGNLQNSFINLNLDVTALLNLYSILKDSYTIAEKKLEIATFLSKATLLLISDLKLKYEGINYELIQDYNYISSNIDFKTQISLNDLTEQLNKNDGFNTKHRIKIIDLSNTMLTNMFTNNNEKFDLVICFGKIQKTDDLVATMNITINYDQSKYKINAINKIAMSLAHLIENPGFLI